jgi:hypothetical protein
MTERQGRLLDAYVRADAPRPGTGPTSSGRRVGTWAFVAEYNRDGSVANLTVSEGLPISRDLLDENGNCASCGLPFNSETSHGYPVCRNTVTLTGDRGKCRVIQQGPSLTTAPTGC